MAEEKGGAQPEKKAFHLFLSRSGRRNFALTVAVQTVAILLVFGLICLTAGFGAVLGVAKAYYDTTPDLDIDQIERQNLTSFIYDMNGGLITDYKGSENRIWVSFEEIPEKLYMAYVSVEDTRFFTHNGIDIKRIAGAFVSNLRNESVQGGSTITQQLIKTRLLSLEQTYKRKLQEAYMAVELEKQYSKEQILEWYLNTIPLGESNYGVKAAAMDYFGKELSQLSLRECATLAGITRNPSRYNPRRNYHGAGSPKLSDDRTNYVLRCMVENGAITAGEYQAALSEPLYVVEKSGVNTLYAMPTAVETVLDDAIDALLESRGLEKSSINRRNVRAEIQTGGYSIYSTIDPKVQKILEETIYGWEHYPELQDPSQAVTRERTADGTIIETPQPQAAAVVYDYRSGEVRAVVGSRTPPTQLLVQNRAVRSTMPVGSSIKPLAVYGPALDLGFSPASVASNMPLPIPGWGTEKGYPSNFTSGSYRGILTLRAAMRASLNTVTANVLFNMVGLDHSVEYLRAFGIDEGSAINKDGPGLALGSSGIPVMQMATAFGTIANKGEYQRPLTFTRITDGMGKTILDRKGEQASSKHQAMQPDAAWMLVDMLVDAVERGTGTPARIKDLTIGGKTGTHSEYRSVFFAGFSPYYSAAVWVGHDEFRPLYKNATGGKEAAPIWKAFMERIHQEAELEDKPIIEDSPESLGLVRATVCSLSGLLATDACRADGDFKPVTDWFRAGTVPTASCNQHQARAICSESGKLATPNCPEDSVVYGGTQLIPFEWGVQNLSPETFYKLFPHGVIVDALPAPGSAGGDFSPGGAYCDIHGPGSSGGASGGGEGGGATAAPGDSGGSSEGSEGGAGAVG
ncbi:MAG: transglycosylase domain-containing protein [Christensenellaceae bacterium]|jgi:penicillin-binding protein 1A|nr:transglycosylase domain-containing protein [Christensenellaceae bacterium]